jgi:hypothetical protein
MHQLALLLFVMTIKGRVTLNGDPLPGAVVTVSQADGIHRTVTDFNGRYRFEQIRGDYSLSAELEGLTVESVHGTSIEMRLSQTAEEICLDCCDDGWDCRPDPQPAASWTPRITHLPVARGIAGAMDLAPGVH